MLDVPFQNDRFYDELAIAMKYNTNITILKYSKCLDGFNSQEALLHCLKRNELIAKYPNLREDILLISAAQKLYISDKNFTNNQKRVGLFAEATVKKLDVLKQQLDNAQINEFEQMCWYGS